jgi:diacylglycerol kinase family enzyme
VVNGTVLFGGDWIFSENSQPDDGKFEVLPFQGHGDWARATIQSHKHNPITDDDRAQIGIAKRTVLQGRNIEVRLFRPDHVDEIPAQIDGEEFVSANHFRVENLFHHLRIIVPEGRSWI